jgi:hypothetical protein
MNRTRLALSRRQAYQLCRVIASSSHALCLMSKARGLYRWRDSRGRVITPVFLAPSDRVDVKRWDNNSSDYYPGVAVNRSYTLEPWELEYITKSLRDYYVTYCGRYPAYDVDTIMRELEGYGHWVMLCSWIELGARGRIVDHPYRDIFPAISLQSAGVGEYIAVRMIDHVPGRYWATKSARDITRYILTRWASGDFDSLMSTFSGTV